jgi:hypothetical protein
MNSRSSILNPPSPIRFSVSAFQRFSFSHLLYRLWPSLYRLRTRCSYCSHIICDRGPLASDDKESHGLCGICKGNPARRAHFATAKNLRVLKT